MREYELVVIISPEVPEENVPQTVERVKQFITERGGTVTDVAQWGKKRLSYPIKRHSEGNYVLASFSMEPDKAAELEKGLFVSEEVIRHLLVKKGE